MILDKLFNKRVICRRDGNPYLTRYYLFRKPVSWMPSIYLHCFHEGDMDLELHDHPWDYSFSVILKGKYKEEYRDKEDQVKERILSPGKINFVTGSKFHRVDLISDKVWTIFVSGRKIKDWGFWDRHTHDYVNWREHEAKQFKDDFQPTCSN